MNLDDLTIGQAKELAKMFDVGNCHHAAGGGTSALHSRNIGKYVIVRSRNEGINAGVVMDADNTGIVLKDARRIWYHKPASASESWYEGVAMTGLSADSRVSCAVPEKVIVEDYSITLCTPAAEESIRGINSNPQS